jgi:Circularly permutated YpsA SLOG family
MLLNKIISGGQTGADIAGLKFAKDNGITAGGWAPKDYMTEKGEMPELKELYNLQEHQGTYSFRTVQNVRESEGTVIFSTKMSDGSRLTLKTCQKENKPYVLNPTIGQFLKWISGNNIKILNIAGDRESDSPGIEQRVYNFLQNALENNGKYSKE